MSSASNGGTCNTVGAVINDLRALQTGVTTSEWKDLMTDLRKLIDPVIEKTFVYKCRHCDRRFPTCAVRTRHEICDHSTIARPILLLASSRVSQLIGIAAHQVRNAQGRRQPSEVLQALKLLSQQMSPRMTRFGDTYQNHMADLLLRVAKPIRELVAEDFNIANDSNFYDNVEPSIGRMFEIVESPGIRADECMDETFVAILSGVVHAVAALVVEMGRIIKSVRDRQHGASHRHNERQRNGRAMCRMGEKCEEKHKCPHAHPGSDSGKESVQCEVVAGEGDCGDDCGKSQTTKQKS